MRRPLCLLCLIFVLLVMIYMTAFADIYLDPDQDQKVSLSEGTCQAGEILISEGENQKQEISRSETDNRERVISQSETDNRERVISQSETDNRERVISQSETDNRERAISQSETDNQERAISQSETDNQERTISLPENESNHKLYGYVYAMEEKNGRSVLYIKSTEENRSVICYLSEEVSSLQSLKIGYQVIIKGKVRRFEAASNDGQFDVRKYYAGMGISYSMTNCAYEVMMKKPWPVRQGLFVIRKKLAYSLDALLSEEDSGVLKAMLLGDKSEMTEEIKGLYQRTGIAHIVAVSGLHISLWGMAICRLLKKLRIPLALANFISFLFVVLYGMMTGSQASAVRSVIMFSLYLLAPVVNRTYDMLTAMMLSAAVLLMFRPAYVFYSGFLLSFGAVSGISLFMPWLTDLYSPPANIDDIILKEKNNMQKISDQIIRFIRVSIMTSLCVSLFSLPIQLCFFYTFSVYSVFLNLLIAPFVSALMILGMIGAVLGSFLPTLSCIPLQICHIILAFYEKLCLFFDRLPLAHPVIAKPEMWKIVVYYAVLGILYLVIMRVVISPSESRQRMSLRDNVQKQKSPRLMIPLQMRLGADISCQVNWRRKSLLSVIRRRGKMLYKEMYKVVHKVVNKLTRKIMHMVMHMVMHMHMVVHDRDEKNKKKLCQIFAIVVLLADILFLCIHPRAGTTLTMLDVGQGDCFVIEEKSGFTAIIDGGSSSVSEVGRYRIDPFLRSHGISTVDFVFLSHADTDHTNGILELLENQKSNRIKIRYLVLTDLEKENEKFDDIMLACKNAGTRVLYFSHGNHIEIHQLKLTCIHPGDKDTKLEGLDENDHSMVLYMEYKYQNKNHTALFMGDLGSAHEKEVMESLSAVDKKQGDKESGGIGKMQSNDKNKYEDNDENENENRKKDEVKGEDKDENKGKYEDENKEKNKDAVEAGGENKRSGKIDILKIGHHGSKYSSTEEFLQLVDPYVCLISAGRKNRYGHPHMETLERIDETDGTVFRTDLMGQVVVDLEKQDIVVRSVYAGR